MKDKEKIFILGAGVTGLSAGYASGLPIFEAQEVPGGICTSYYLKKGETTRRFVPPADGNAYHFETGGGHWIFGGQPDIKELINKLSPYNIYQRKSSVYFPQDGRFVPYPIQNNLAYLGKKTAKKALDEILRSGSKNKTMKDWMLSNFGRTLCKIFFFPFHDLYTAGLYTKIAPQDSYKSPINREEVINGYNGVANPVGYNTNFIYPRAGLDSLTRALAEKCDVRYGKKVVKIDCKNKKIFFADKTSQDYNKLLSTLPLNVMAKIAQVKTSKKSFPSPSVLVMNIGAVKGPKCPDDHWIYVPESKSGFHRVGFYSNVDPMFLPQKNQKNNDRVSVYVEKAYPENTKLSKSEVSKLAKNIGRELQAWGWIKEVEVCDPTWIETAYTWSWPGSTWKDEVLRELDENDIIQVGRYGRWIFQGIADSIKDGLEIGKSLK